MDDLSARSAATPPAKLSAHRREYERRVNRVMDYVQAHLADELTLEKLAAVAAFSPFHFHRVFAAITGETLSDFIRRIRLERAASALGLLHDTSVLEIALRYGFSSAATTAVHSAAATSARIIAGFIDGLLAAVYRRKY